MKKKLLFFLNNIEEIIAGICLALMTFITFANVVGRYFFTRPLTWGDEMSMLLAGWAVFMGMSAAYKRKMHLGMEFFVNKSRKRTKIALQSVITVVLFALCIVLAIVAWALVMKTTKRTQIMRASYKIIYSSCAAGFTMMAIRSGINLFNCFFRKEKFIASFIHEEEEKGTEEEI